MNPNPIDPVAMADSLFEGGPPTLNATGSSSTSGIYGIWCSKNERWYVGRSRNVYTRCANHRYMLDRGDHRNSMLQRAWRKYGESAFLWVVLAAAPTAELPKLELEFTEALHALAPSGFVLIAGGPENQTSEITRRALSLSKLGHPTSQETKLKISAALKGRPLPPHVTKLMSERHIKIGEGKPLSSAHRLKISKALAGRKLSPEHCQHISECQRGRKLSPENSKAQSLRQLGRRPTAETRARQSAAKLGRPWSPAQRKAHEEKSKE